MMDHTDLAGVFSGRRQNFAWFIGASASRTAGLPTASDLTWNTKRRHYCKEENQQT